ncbi:MAG: hypothetical protein D6715_04580 [Calditrichaeota bacterium]|nr:MAG: hypothetical protein D6715_04580 [Calditrichota bacterium]
MEDAMKLSRLLALVVLVFAVSFGFTQYYQQISGMGGIDWTAGVVRATGIGAPNPNMPPSAQRAGAIEAAKRVALRNLLEMVKGVYVNSETTIENAMVSSDLIRTRVEGVVRNFRVVDTRYMSTGDVEVDVEVPLSSFYDVFLPPETGQAGQPLLCPTCGQPWPKGKPYPFPRPQKPGQTNEGTAGATSVAYSGLIVDARGLGVRPALAPRILDEQGNEVYGTGYVSRDYAIQIGVVGYEKAVDRARSNERVAPNPLVIKGLKAAGPNHTDVVISNTDAQMIRAAAANLNFLDQCKVMIVLD